MNYLSISIFVALILGIVFIVLKINNDEYINNQRKTEPNFTNNISDMYLGISITFFSLFFILLLIWLYSIFNKKIKELEYISPLFEPIMSYNTSSDASPTTTTPLGISTSKNYMSFPTPLRI
jgi:formate-dependent nitrite reductase membrane component NrfD